MQRIGGNAEALLGLTQSTADSNRLYSILLDARASSVTENMYDVTEKLLSNEKENAKLALDQLWSLKKNMQIQGETSTLDLLIAFYQDKLDILRNKEENIKRVSRDSRSLLEEKRKKDAEIASVRQEIQDCTEEIGRLNERLTKARIKSEELKLIEEQLNRELAGNENEIINGLYEIILAHRPVIEADDEAEVAPGAGAATVKSHIAMTPDSPASGETSDGSGVIIAAASQPEPALAEPEPQSLEELHALYQQIESRDSNGFPKSVVKTTRGVVIGEYYYDPRVYKNKRHYVFNSIYFMEQLARSVQNLKAGFDATLHAEMGQMIQDAYKRVAGNPNLHFEISTNELVNEKNLRQLWQSTKEKDHREVLKFCNRLSAKIAALGGNYKAMLNEQIERYAQSP